MAQSILSQFAARVHPLLTDALKGHYYYWVTDQAEREGPPEPVHGPSQPKATQCWEHASGPTSITSHNVLPQRNLRKSSYARNTHVSKEVL